jgi:S-adenosylmethionine hydrolase
MTPTKIITLTTDFGQRDSYVGQMKGAALGVAPEVRLVDLCHEVPPQQVRSGAYILETGYRAFPSGTIHVVVVDPGVGTDRRMLAVEAGGHVFVAPDNGLLSRVLDRQPATAVHELRERSYFGPQTSTTFAGRDVFAPVAAWIARGVELPRLGPAVSDPVRLPPAGGPLTPGAATRVEVVHVDHFGNVVLDVTAERLASALGQPPTEGSALRVATARTEVAVVRQTYARSVEGIPFLLINSAGYLEVAVNAGRADEALGLEAGMEVDLIVGA